MNGLKSIFEARTVLTTIVVAIFALLAAFCVVNIDPQVQEGIVTALFALAGFFRFTATKQLTVGKPGPGL